MQKQKPKSMLMATLAITSLSVTGLMLPASAATTSLTIPQSAVGEINETNTALTKNLAVRLSVPSEDKVLATNSLAITLSGLTPATEVSAKATNAKLVSALHTEASPVRSSSGSDSLTLQTGGGSTVTFFAYTISSDFGTVAISYQGNTTTYHLKGIAGPAYNLSLTTPSHMELSSSQVVSATVSDVFGNVFDSETVFNPATGIQTAVVGGASFGSFAWNSTTKRFEATLSSGATPGTMAVSAQISATGIATLTAPKNIAIANIEVKNLSAEISLLRTQLQKLTLEAAQAKTKYNKLAKKWNKKFPTKKLKQIN